MYIWILNILQYLCETQIMYLVDK